MTDLRRLRSVRRLVVALAALLVGAELLAQDTVFLYALNERGKLSLGGTIIETLPGQFDPNDDIDPREEHRWVDLVVAGSDRYALRADGRIQHNGAKLTSALPFVVGPDAPFWLRLVVQEDEVLALRSDGLVWNAQAQVSAHDAATWFFSDLAATATATFALRVDGAVFSGNLATPVALMQAGAGLIGPMDGTTPETWWVRLQIDVASGLLVGLRADGKVHTLDPAKLIPPPGGMGGGDPPTPPVSTELATLPFPTVPLQFDDGDIYLDRAVLADASWLAITQDGRVVQSTDTASFLTNLPGGVSAEGTTFIDLMTFGDEFWSLRFDGKLFQGVEATPIIDLVQGRYLSMAASDVTPDLSNAVNRKPVASVYKTRVVEGDTATSVPIIVSDIDRAAADLVLTYDFEKLPGATLSEGATGQPSVLVPAGLEVGKYRFRLLVDDGVTPKPRVFKYPVRVLPLDDNVEKNRPPAATKIKRVQALVGLETVVPLLAADRDGDVVSFEPVLDKGVFLKGAAFDAVTNTLSWTPVFADIGKSFARFKVSDGTKTRRLNVRFVVVNPIIF